MMDRSNQPLSEQYRLAATDWVEKDSAANLLEDLKSAMLSQRMALLNEKTVSKAEMEVKASPEWEDYITKTVEARKAANLAKVTCEYLRMKFWECNSHEATERVERRM